MSCKFVFRWVATPQILNILDIETPNEKLKLTRNMVALSTIVQLEEAGVYNFCKCHHLPLPFYLAISVPLTLASIFLSHFR